MKDLKKTQEKGRSDLAWKLHYAVSRLGFTQMGSCDHERYKSCERFLLAFADHVLAGGDPDISAEDLRRKLF
ncbi:MAG: hypothetical protein IT233_09420 [Bacteroidia bacterium]|nr:hypothetical protein [Bacteroidia bacterium]